MCRPIPSLDTNEVDLKVKFPNGSTITLYGADNPDSLRGIVLHGVVFDEYSQQPSNIFTEIIQATLATTGGYSIWIGTPKGKNQLYDLYQKALANPSEYLTIFKTIEDTIAEETGPTVEKLKGALEDAQKLVIAGLMTEDELRQEFYCSFEASIKGAYYSTEIERARAEGRIKPVPYDSGLLVYTVWDLGYGDSTAIGFYQKDGAQIRMIDYYEDSGKAFPFYKTIIDNRGYTYGQHFAPHDSSHHEFQTGMTLIQFAAKLGVHFSRVPEIGIEAGINSGRLALNRMVLDASKTEEFLDKLAQYHKEWDDKRGSFKDRPKHDFTSHAADVHRYMGIVEPEFSNDTLLEQPFNLYSHSYA